VNTEARMRKQQGARNRLFQKAMRQNSQHSLAIVADDGNLMQLFSVARLSSILLRNSAVSIPTGLCTISTKTRHD
jgi:hypothetical protein